MAIGREDGGARHEVEGLQVNREVVERAMTYSLTFWHWRTFSRVRREVGPPGSNRSG